MQSKDANNRRAFLKSLAGTAAVAGFPTIIPASALGADGNVPPSDRIVMGSIGVGGQGGGHLRSLLNFNDVRLVGVCDVQETRRQSAKKSVDARYGEDTCTAYNDFRELLARPDIDAVLIAVPDHWHALIGLEAARNGKHMYYEKPMGVSFAEAKAMREAVKRYGVTFQFGTQQRSQEQYRVCAELVQNGKIGQLKEIIIASANSQYIPNQPEQPIPAGFDYNMWLGPAPWAPYTAERCTRNFTLIYDYSIGCISGAWGVHDVDSAQWINGTDDTGPVSVEGAGVLPKEGLYDTFSSWDVVHTYANGVKLRHLDRTTATKVHDQFKIGGMASMFIGTEGWIYVSRSEMRTNPANLSRSGAGPNEKQLPHSNEHHRNFFDAIRKGTLPISPIEAAVRADTICQQADIALRLGRKLRWDPVKEQFDDEEANRMLARPMRSPWHL
jgi:predicted dehydrogenase